MNNQRYKPELINVNTTLKQPTNSVGKKISYRTVNAEFWHIPYPADLLNWGKLELGQISEYVIIC